MPLCKRVGLHRGAGARLKSAPQQHSAFNGPGPLDRSSGWPRVCDWSPIQSRSVREVAPSSFGPGGRFLACAWRTATPERDCAESQSQQRSPFTPLTPFDHCSICLSRSTDLLAGRVAATGLRHSRAPSERLLLQALDRAEDFWPAPGGPRRRSATVLKASRSNARHSRRLRHSITVRYA